MKESACCLLALLLAAPAQGAGYYHTADALARLRIAYDRNDPEAKAAYFRGYVVGVADTTRGTAWCPPADVSAEQTQRIVSEYMQAQPAAADADAVTVVTAALDRNFPCPHK